MSQLMAWLLLQLKFSDGFCQMFDRSVVLQVWPYNRIRLVGKPLVRSPKPKSQTIERDFRASSNMITLSSSVWWRKFDFHTGDISNKWKRLLLDGRWVDLKTVSNTEFPFELQGERKQPNGEFCFSSKICSQNFQKSDNRARTRRIRNSRGLLLEISVHRICEGVKVCSTQFSPQTFYIVNHAKF